MVNSKGIISHWGGLTYLDANQRDDDPLQPFGMLAGDRLL